MAELTITDASLPGRAGLVDLTIGDGRITSIGSPRPPAGEVLDAGGHLVATGFVDTHLHLDKSRINDRYRVRVSSLDGAIRETARIKAGFTEQDIYERAQATLRDCISHGTTTVRTHVEVDEVVGLRGFHALQRLAADYADLVDLELCVFAQEGLTHSPAGQRLLDRALGEGAAAIGGAPYADRDPAGQLDLVFAYARRHDVPIDLHLDLADTTEGMLIEDLCERTVAAGWQGRVTAGHVTQLSYVEPGRRDEIADLIAASGIAVTVLPATDLYLSGRAYRAARPRGVLDVRPLLDRGTACSVATNNVMNAFTPFGDGSLLRMANLYANVTQLASDELERCFSLISTSAARVMGRNAQGLREGTAADLVCLPVPSPELAIATVPPPLWVMKAGRVTVSREAPQIAAGRADGHPLASIGAGGLQPL
jgi:cytosine/creatinine deaminase